MKSSVPNFPLGIWMRRGLRPLVRARLGQSRLAEAGIFNQPYVDSLVTQHLSGKIDHSYRLWLLLCLEFWYDIYIEQADVPSLQQEAQAIIAFGG